MLMNRVETALVNSPPRRWLQSCYEVPALLRFGGRLPPGARALEIGCGSGYGSQLVLERFGAASVDAVDLDPEDDPPPRRAAPRRLRRPGSAGSRQRNRPAVRLGCRRRQLRRGVRLRDRSPHPRLAGSLAEVARMLTPGGRVYFEEVTAHALARPTYQRLFDHPTEDRFTAEQFIDELPHHGLVVLGCRSPASRATICSASPPNRPPPGVTSDGHRRIGPLRRDDADHRCGSQANPAAPHR